MISLEKIWIYKAKANIKEKNYAKAKEIIKNSFDVKEIKG